MVILIFLQIQYQPFPYPEYDELSSLRNEVPKFIFVIVILTTFLLSFPLISHIIEEKESGVKVLIRHHLFCIDDDIVWVLVLEF